MLAPREILSLRVIFYKWYIIPKIECLQVENIKLDTYLREYEVYFWINASIVAFLSNHMSFGILMTSLQNLNSNLLQNVKKTQFILRLKFNYSSLLLFCRPSFCHACCLSWSTRIMFNPMLPGNMGWNIFKRNAGLLIDDIRRDVVINFVLTCHELSFLIGQFEVEV